MKKSARIKIRLAYLTACIILICSLSKASAQIIGGEDESKFYAESKQVNQFFRRFNGEEDEKGNRYYPGDKFYRSTKLRKKYMAILFDESSAGISKSLKTEFTNKILERPEANMLDFHSGNWFAEVHTIFSQHGTDQTIVLFMTLEKAQLGSKWVISKAFGDMFKPYFVRDTTKVGRFLHPMSHELDFMNLRKAFLNKDSLGQFTSKKFIPDHLSVLLYALKNGDLTYKSVEQVKFHFFQIDGWYFEISEFNRSGYNTGWLISNLVKLNNAGERDLMLKYLLYEK
jgi:hypothetical protein